MVFSTRLVTATRQGDTDQVQQQLAEGASPDSRDERDVTVLILAANAGHTGIAYSLLNAGADVNISFKGWTPLVAAIHSGSEDIIRLLLNFGADVESKDSRGFTPLLQAASRIWATAAVEMLIAVGADVNATVSGKEGEEQHTPLLEALRNDHFAAAVLLEQAGVTVDDLCRDLMAARDLRLDLLRGTAGNDRFADEIDTGHRRLSDG